MPSYFYFFAVFFSDTPTFYYYHGMIQQYGGFAAFYIIDGLVRKKRTADYLPLPRTAHGSIMKFNAKIGVLTMCCILFVADIPSQSSQTYGGVQQQLCCFILSDDGISSTSSPPSWSNYANIGGVVLQSFVSDLASQTQGCFAAVFFSDFPSPTLRKV